MGHLYDCSLAVFWYWFRTPCVFRSTVTDEGTDDIITSDSRTVAVADEQAATTRVDQTGTNVCGVEIT